MKIVRNIFLLVITALLVNCEAKDVDGELKPKDTVGNGNNNSNLELNKKIFIVSSGTGNRKGTINYISPEGELTETIFNRINPVNLGLNVNSYVQDGDKLGYLCLNDSIVTIYNHNFFHDVIKDVNDGSILSVLDDNIKKPRDIAIIDSKGYVTNWGDNGYISELNLFTTGDVFTEKPEFPTVNPSFKVHLNTIQPDRIIAQSGKLLVTHLDQKEISIITPSTKTVKEIEVNSLPVKLKAISTDRVAVLCTGKSTAEDRAAIHIINMNDESISNTIDFIPGETPTSFTIKDEYFYFTMSNAIYKIKTDAVNSGEKELIINTNPLTQIEISGDIAYTINQVVNGRATFVAYNLDTRTIIKSIILNAYGSVRINLKEIDFLYSPENWID